MQLIVRTTEKVISSIEEEVANLFYSINQECKHLTAMKQLLYDIQGPITTLENHVTLMEGEMEAMVLWRENFDIELLQNESETNSEDLDDLDQDK